MSKVYLEDTILTNIANSIRNKNGQVTKYKPQDMSAAIDSISTGGGGGGGNFSGAFIMACEDNNTSQETITNIVNTINNNPNTFYDISKMFYKNTEITSLTLDFTNNNICDINSLFCYCTLLNTLNLNLDTSNVYDMSNLFSNCKVLETLNLGENFATENVVDMNNMFSQASKLKTLDVSNFNTSKVKNMGYMFSYMGNLTGLDVSNWDTSKVVDMGYMFQNTIALQTLDLSSFDTSNVTVMTGMFSAVSSNNLRTLIISDKFDTSKVGSFNAFLRNCKSLSTFDSTKLKFDSATNLSQMFYNCQALKHLDFSNTRFPSTITDVSSMLYGCSNLETLELGANFTPNTSTVSLFAGTTFNQNCEVKMTGSSDFSSYNGSATLNFSYVWRGNDSTKIANFETFANSLEPCSNQNTRTIQLYSTLYNALSDTQKAIITNKGYQLSYS